MDLTTEYPRSPNVMLAGIVSLARMIDKSHANDEGTLGDYDVDCPHDKPVLAFLGIDFTTFAAEIKGLGYDTNRIEAWAKPLVNKHTSAEITAFNESRRHWAPDAHSQGYFDSMKTEVAPARPDVTTWFQLLDLDEKRAA